MLSKISIFSIKNCKTLKETGKRGDKGNRKCLPKGPNDRLIRDYKVATINMFKELKETRLKEVMEGPTL